jgi:hypothetical protein
MTTQPAITGAAPVLVQAAPNNLVPATTRTTTSSRNRITLGFDYFNIPIPFPRLYSTPGRQRVVTETEYASPQESAVQMAVTAQPMQYVQQQPMVALAATAATQSYVQPTTAVAYAPATAAMAPPPAAVAVVQQQQPPPQQPVVTTAVVPATTAVAVPVQPVTQGACLSAPASKESVEELTRRLQAVQALLKQEQEKQAQAAAAAAAASSKGGSVWRPLPPLGGKPE